MREGGVVCAGSAILVSFIFAMFIMSLYLVSPIPFSLPSLSPSCYLFALFLVYVISFVYDIHKLIFSYLYVYFMSLLWPSSIIYSFLTAHERAYIGYQVSTMPFVCCSDH